MSACFGLLVRTTLIAVFLQLPANARTLPIDPAAAERRAFAKKILESTTQVWRRQFASHGRTYKAPGAMFLRDPIGHPSRGFGYVRRVGVIVDVSDMIDLRQAHPASADLISALIIAHETAHHVQRQIEAGREVVRAGLSERELEADCAAGWWLAKANARSQNRTGAPFLAPLDLASELPRAIALLSGRDRKVDAEAVTADTHGRADQRVSAIELGLRSADVEECGDGMRF